MTPWHPSRQASWVGGTAELAGYSLGGLMIDRYRQPSIKAR